MAVNDIVMGAAGASGPATYVEDVFSTWLYTGNSTASNTQTITNGIDLAGKGGLVWIKQRSGARGHRLTDTARGVTKELFTNSTAAQGTELKGVTAFNSTGFDIGGDFNYNELGTTFASWTFREQPKFFDVVTYTGTGSVQNIAHSLGSAPGCIIVKCTSNNGYNWAVYHRSLGATKYMILNSTVAVDTASVAWNDTEPTATQFTVGTSGTVNDTGATFVAYLFAHDAGGFGATGTDNVISCGSFTTDGSGNATVNLGYEPQWILHKQTAVSGGNWAIYDVMRGWNVAGTDNYLMANLSVAEGGFQAGFPTATGFQVVDAPSQPYIYIAIRRPMKTPTTGTEVFAPSTWTSNSSSYTGIFIDSGFSVDLSILGFRNQAYGAGYFADRLRGFTSRTSSSSTGSQNLESFSTVAEYASSNTFGGDSNTGVKHNGMTNSTTTEVNWNFRRAPGFFDEVCYTGGTANIPTTVTISGQTFGRVTHNLGVTPELIIIKSRTGATNWIVGSSLLGQSTFGKNALLNLTNAAVEGGFLPLYSEQTASYITVNNNVLETGLSGATYVAYLFATVAGVSKVFSFTGNGSSQTINCSFTTGARFILIKRTNSTGDWYVWDSARGIVSGNDPHLSLNTTAAEVTTDDTIDPDSSGFIVNQVSATNVNVNGATYIGLAIA